MTENKITPAVPGDYVWQLRVRCANHLDEYIQDYFEGMTTTYQEDGSCILSGELPDMPAVYGFILHLRDTGISLLSLQVKRITEQSVALQGKG